MLVVFHSADEFEWYDNLDVDEEIENGGNGEYGSDDFDGIYSDVCEGGINDGESDGDDGNGESDDGGGDSDKGSDGDSRSDCDGDGDGDGDDVSEGPGGVPARIAQGQCHPRRMLNAYLTKGGCCKDSCILKYGDLPKRHIIQIGQENQKGCYLWNACYD